MKIGHDLVKLVLDKHYYFGYNAINSDSRRDGKGNKMKKYDLLNTLYNEEIKSIKNLETEMESAKERQDWTAWNALNSQYGIETTQLREEVEAEYSSVPFDGPAKQGIAKFWEKAFGR